MRINLVNGFDTSLNTPGVYELLQKYFDVHRVDHFNQPGITIINQRDKCNSAVDGNVIVENLWEVPEGRDGTLEDARWFWVNEALWYKELKLDSYISNKTWEHAWLIPVNRKKPWRSIFLSMIKDRLDACVWSYCEEGKDLPNSLGAASIQDQREFNSLWWNSTSAYVSVESSVAINQTLFPTEKTLKAFAFSSPVVIAGQKGILELMRSWGFQSWSELWDESYDQIDATIPRLSAVAEIIKKTTINNYPKIVQEKLDHNRNLFWSQDRLVSMFEEIIVNPIMKF